LSFGSKFPTVKMLILRVLTRVKNSIKYLLQQVLGYRKYLYVFAKFKIRTLQKDAKERDFFTFLSLLHDGEGDVLDVGANIGIMSYHLSKALPSTTIHAFEPIPSNFNVLSRIVANYRLTNVRCYQIAVGDEQGTAKMVLPVNNKTLMQGLSHIKHESITEWNEGHEFEVPLETLDHILANAKIQGIKIDVENFEYYALKGASQLLETHKPVIYAELWDNKNRQQCFDLLNGFGYTTYVVEQGELTPFNAAVHQQQNFIFRVN